MQFRNLEIKGNSFVKNFANQQYNLSYCMLLKVTLLFTACVVFGAYIETDILLHNT